MSNKAYQDYLKHELQKCEVKLPSLEGERYMICLSYINRLKVSIKKGIPKNVDNSIPIPPDLEGKI